MLKKNVANSSLNHIYPKLHRSLHHRSQPHVSGLPWCRLHRGVSYPDPIFHDQSQILINVLIGDPATQLANPADPTKPADQPKMPIKPRKVAKSKLQKNPEKNLPINEKC